MLEEEKKPESESILKCKLYRDAVVENPYSLLESTARYSQHLEVCSLSNIEHTAKIDSIAAQPTFKMVCQCVCAQRQVLRFQHPIQIPAPPLLLGVMFPAFPFSVLYEVEHGSCLPELSCDFNVILNTKHLEPRQM